MWSYCLLLENYYKKNTVIHAKQYRLEMKIVFFWYFVIL